MKHFFLALAALLFAVPALAGTPIVPKAAAVVTDHDFGSPYRISDDPKGLLSGAQFLRLKGVPARGGFRFAGDSHDVQIADVDLALKAPQTGFSLPAMIEIVGTKPRLPHQSGDRPQQLHGLRLPALLQRQHLLDRGRRLPHHLPRHEGDLGYRRLLRPERAHAA